MCNNNNNNNNNMRRGFCTLVLFIWEIKPTCRSPTGSKVHKYASLVAVFSGNPMILAMGVLQTCHTLFDQMASKLEFR